MPQVCKTWPFLAGDLVMRALLTLFVAICFTTGVARAADPAWATTGGYVAISAGDAKGLGRWYVDIVDFKVLREERLAERNIDVVILMRGNALIEIVQQPDTAKPQIGARGWRESWRTQGYFKAGIFVDNLDAVEVMLKTRNAKFAFGPMKAKDDPFRSFAIVDPEGNLLQFFGV
jgi:hypothetical protein